MNVLQRAIFSHTSGAPPPPNNRQLNSCNICQLRFNSQSQAEAHYKGNKHARTVKVLEAHKTKPSGPVPRVSTRLAISMTTCTSPTAFAEKNINTTAVDVENVSAVLGPETPPPVSALPRPQLQPSIGLTSPTGRILPTVTTLSGAPALGRATAQEAAIVNSQSMEETAKKLLQCSLCKVVLNSLSQLQAHNSGTKHKTMEEARNGCGPIKSYPKPHIKLQGHTKPGSGLHDKVFHCQLCDVCVNSEVQLKQHISSRRHKDRVAGKPPKPRFSPYNKELGKVPAPTMLLPLQNRFPESVTARFLPNPMAAAMTTGSPSLSPRPTTAPLIFQAPPMVQRLLRPAVGPMRSPHTPILFAPY